MSNRRIRLDTSALRESADFRRIFFSGTVSMLGSWITYVTIPLQVKQITNSYAAVGIIGLIELFPMLVFGLLGGAIADTKNRKAVVLLTEFALMLSTGVLFLNAVLGFNNLYVLYAVAFLFAIFDAIQRPTLDSIKPLILPTDLLASSGALSSLRWTLGSILGPAIGGFIAATSGVEWCYGIDIVSYFISMLFLIRLSAKATQRNNATVNVRMVFSGFNYARSRPDLIGTYVVDIIAMLFAFPSALFPFIASDFHATWALGWLYAAMSIGSLIASTTSGWVKNVHHHGRAIVFAACAWGIAIAIAGFAPNIYFVIVALVVAGGADMISGLFRGLIWNTTIPLDMRGRLAGIEMLSYMTGPQLGQVRATLVAQWTSLRVSLISGGIFCSVGTAAIGYGLRQLWNFDNRTNEYAVAERIARGE
jgi:MFS family permease